MDGLDKDVIIVSMIDALKFYGDRKHFLIDNDWEFNVDGESPNWLSNPDSESVEEVEDGSVARTALNRQITRLSESYKADILIELLDNLRHEQTVFSEYEDALDFINSEITRLKGVK